MALPPSIPTSFVPKQPVAPSARKRTSGLNPFLTLSYIILAIMLLGALATFGYKYYLGKVADQKAAALVKAQNEIDQATVSQFIRLRDRFTTAKTVLSRHVSLSGFFDELEFITLQNVRFTALKLNIQDNRTATIEMSGMARNFNALAAQSSAFAAEKRFKRAIFSGFILDGKDGSVTFSMKADVDPSLILQSAQPLPTAAETLPAEPQPPVDTAPQP